MQGTLFHVQFSLFIVSRTNAASMFDFFFSFECVRAEGENGDAYEREEFSFAFMLFRKSFRKRKKRRKKNEMKPCQWI